MEKHKWMSLRAWHENHALNCPYVDVFLLFLNMFITFKQSKLKKLP